MNRSSKVSRLIWPFGIMALALVTLVLGAITTLSPSWPVTAFDGSPTAGTLSITANTILTGDHTGTIFISTNSVTLDCNGHTVTGPGTIAGFGVFVSGATGVTVKNCNITGMSNGVILSGGSNGAIIQDNTINGNTTGVKSFGSSNVAPMQGRAFAVEADTVLVSVGQEALVPRGWGLGLTPQGTIKANGRTLVTEREGVFAGGDAVSGPDSIVEAMAQGKRAAVGIDQYLGGDGDITESLAPEPGEEMEMPQHIAQQGKPVVPMPTRDPGERKYTFAMVERRAIARRRRSLRLAAASAATFGVRAPPRSGARSRARVPAQNVSTNSRSVGFIGS